MPGAVEVIGPVTESALKGLMAQESHEYTDRQPNMGFILPTRFSGYSWASNHSNLQVLGPAPPTGAELVQEQ